MSMQARIARLEAIRRGGGTPRLDLSHLSDDDLRLLAAIPIPAGDEPIDTTSLAQETQAVLARVSGSRR